MFELRKSVLISNQKETEKKIVSMFERALAMTYIPREDTEYQQGYTRGYNSATAAMRSIIAGLFEDVLENIYDPEYLDVIIKGVDYLCIEPDSKVWKEWRSIHE